MTTATLRIQKKLHVKIDAISLPSANWKLLFFAGFFMMAVSLVFYAWQINDLTKGSYTINSFEKKISQLSSENQNLQVAFAENSFMGQAMEKAQALNFEKTTSVKYIQVSENSFTAFK